MSRLKFLIIFSVAVFLRSGFFETASGNSISCCLTDSDQDSLSGRQFLYNGRVWRDIYYSIKGDPFHFTNEFNPGFVTINGKIFNGIRLRYDIHNDEVMTITDRNKILQLNKEMVDDFVIKYNNVPHTFCKLETDSINNLKGYVEVLYNRENIALYVKYKKDISFLSEGKTSSFYQYNMVYIFKEGVEHQINRKKDFMILFRNDKKLIRSFIKSNKIRVMVKKPETFVPVLEFYNSVGQ